MVPSEPQTLARPGSGEMYTAAPAPPPRPFGQIDDGADGTSTLMLNEGAGRVPSTLVSAQPSAAPKQPIVASGPRAEMTQMAGAAIDFAEFFNLAFKKGLEGAWPCRIELTAPAGQSTGGGTQAMQHIRLVPDDGSPTLVIGSVNRGLQRVELRTYAFTANMYAQRRKGMVFPVDEPRFTAIIDRLQNFFTSQRYDVGRADSQVTGEFTASQLNLPRPPGMGQADEKRPSVVLMLAGLVVVALVAGVVTSMVMAKRPPLRVPAAASTAK